MTGGSLPLSWSIKVQAARIEELLAYEALPFQHFQYGERSIGEDGSQKRPFLTCGFNAPLLGSLHATLWGVKVKDVAQHNYGFQLAGARLLSLQPQAILTPGQNRRLARRSRVLLDEAERCCLAHRDNLSL